jgi:transposase
VTSQQDFGVDLLGPTRSGGRWQEREKQGFALSDFAIDFKQGQAICPAGKTSKNWTPAIDKGKNQVIKIRFSTKDCGKCSFQAQCTHSNPPRRTLTVRPEEQHQILQAAHEREQTKLFKQEYDKRAGVEGTISQGIRRCDMRRSRYRGLAKTRLQHIFSACAINIVRTMNWLSGEKPQRTKYSAFVKLHTLAAA